MLLLKFHEALSIIEFLYARLTFFQLGKNLLHHIIGSKLLKTQNDRINELGKQIFISAMQFSKIFFIHHPLSSKKTSHRIVSSQVSINLRRTEQTSMWKGWVGNGKTTFEYRALYRLWKYFLKLETLELNVKLAYYQTKYIIIQWAECELFERRWLIFLGG